MRRAAILCLLAALCLAAPAQAEGPAPSRNEYVIALEAECKPRALATQRAVEGVGEDLRAERLRVAAAKFAAAGRLFAATITAIAPIARPPEDEEKLAKWFAYLGKERSYLGKIASQLREGRTIASQRSTARFVHNGNLANNTVLGFGFHYCEFDLSRFR